MRDALTSRDYVDSTLWNVDAYAPLVVKKYAADELVGVAEIAQRLGVGTSIVHDWRRRNLDFPAPVVVLSMGLVFSWPQVARWAERTKRLP